MSRKNGEQDMLKRTACGMTIQQIASRSSHDIAPAGADPAAIVPHHVVNARHCVSIAASAPSGSSQAKSGS
jgi:hypothetical protein